MNHLILKLLRRHLSVGQMLGFFLANLLGMSIILGGVQFYQDVQPVFTSGDSFMKPEYLVVAKRVSSLRTLSGKAPSFKEREIAEVEEQPFVKSVGCFVPAQFDVNASLGSAELGFRFSTEMFFEAIPNDYVDVDISQWEYQPGDEVIPIVLPRNYLNLYNFGFAGSRGLPALSEGVVGMVNMNFHLRGSAQSCQMRGRVVDFSDRLNTILVPKSFMDYANAMLSPNQKPVISRLIIEVGNPADERIAQFLQENGYVTESGGGDAGRMTYFLRLIVGIVMGIGLVICALSFYVLLLSIYLLLQKHTEKMDHLLLIGYSPSSVAAPFHGLSLFLNLFVLILSWGVVHVLRLYYLPLLTDVYPMLEVSSMHLVILIGGGLFALVGVLNYWAIRRKVVSIWFMHNSADRPKK